MIFSAQATRDYWTPMPVFLASLVDDGFSSPANIHHTAKLRYFVNDRLAPVYRGCETRHWSSGRISANPKADQVEGTAMEGGGVRMTVHLYPTGGSGGEGPLVWLGCKSEVDSRTEGRRCRSLGCVMMKETG
jgi:hypothetical protein